MKNTLLFVGCLAALPVLGQEKPAVTQVSGAHSVAVGVLGSYQVVGLQAEYRAAPHWALKLAGARQFGQERGGEYGAAGLVLATYYFATSSSFVEPFAVAGPVYSRYHWALLGSSGNVNDWNVGGGFGTNLRFSERFRTSASVVLLNGFRAEYLRDDIVIAGRRLVVFPTLSLDIML